jgi:predicted DNA binding protein
MVSQFVALDRLDGWVLYRIEWNGRSDGLLSGIDAIGGAILEATRDDGWQFRLRFPNHDALSQFYNYCMDQNIPVHIERSFTLTEKSDVGRRFDLSQPQREALLAALRNGYFDTPSQTSLDELATEFGISEQALSNRIRRGTKAVLQRALL